MSYDRAGEDAVFDKRGEVVGNGRVEESVFPQVKVTKFQFRVLSENPYWNLGN